MTIPEGDRSLEAVLAASLFSLLLFLIVGNRLLLSLPIILMAGALLSPTFALVVGKGWFNVAHLLGTINSRVLLATLFFGVLTPLALVSRLFRPNMLQIRKDRTTSTYFVARPRQFIRDDFEKLW